MGQSSSSAALPLADPRIPYFALTFQAPDKLTLALADDTIVEQTQRAIRDSVSTEDSIQNDAFLHCEGKTDMNAYEFKFRDIPFMRGCGDGVHLRSIRMCCLLLENYEEHGWKLHLASDFSRGKETTTWFFQRPSGHGGDKKNIICVSITGGDTIQLVNAPAYLRRLLARAVTEGYSDDAIKKESLSHDEEYIIHLTDHAWLSEDAVIRLRVRRLMLQTVRLFETEGGYRFYGTVNTKGSWDSMFFIEMGDNEQQEFNDRAYFALSLNSGSCITVIDAPAKDVIDAVLRATVRYWSTKIHSQTELDEKGAHEIRLKGSPWYATGGDEAVAARIFICGLLETLYLGGYDALAALDVTRGFSDKALFIFRSRESSSSLRGPQYKAAFLLQESSQPFWCISLYDESKIRLINAPENIRLAIRHAIDQIWPWGIHRESRFYNEECYVFKLGTGPWGAEHHQNLAALMSYILKVVNDQGGRAVVSADVTGRYIANNHGGSHSLDVHSWFLKSESTSSSGNGKRRDGRRDGNVGCSSGTEREETDEELAPLRPQGEWNQRRGTRRKISAVEYTSYVINAEENEQQNEGKSVEEDTVGPLTRFDKPLKRVEPSRRKASTLD